MDTTDQEQIERVTRAMLAMQRASWEQGVAAQALLERGDTALAYLMAEEAVLRQGADGRLAVVYHDNGVTDPAAIGEALLAAARATGEPALQAAAGRMLAYLLHQAPRAADGTLYHILSGPEIWVDSLYMAPPFLAAAGHYDEALRQISGVRAALWKPARRLFAHRWDAERQAFANDRCWGVGNGWAAAGMVRVIRALPAAGAPWAAAARDELIAAAQSVIDGCLAHIRADGLFHNIVDDPTTFVETNLAQMLAYSIFRGAQDGWLAATYLPFAQRMRAAARRQVDLAGYVQGVCGAPDFSHPGRAVEGQAFFLLMEAAWRDWRQGASSDNLR